MPNSKIHAFSEFNDFHKLVNGAVRAHHADIHVFQFSDVGKDSSQNTPLFKTNFYQIGLFREVKFEVSYFGKVQVINQKNAVVLFKPGQTVAFHKADPEAKGFAIMFKENFIDWRLNNSNTLRDFSILNPEYNCVLFLDDNAFGELIEIAERMHHEYSQINIIQTVTVLQLYCQILIEKINRLNTKFVNPVANTVHFKTTQEFKLLVFENIHKTKNVAEYAEMLCVTEKTLINHFKQITESTPKDFINQVIIEESKALLINNATVHQVSDYFNFTDQAHFANFFRKMTGQSPRDFKKN